MFLNDVYIHDNYVYIRYIEIEEPHNCEDWQRICGAFGVARVRGRR